MPFFDHLTPDLQLTVRNAAERRQLKDGEALVRLGELGRSLFLVKRGALEARTGEGVLSITPPGELVGELAFLDGRPRSADLLARGDTLVLCWSGEVMDELVRDHPDLRVALLEHIALRQAEAVRRLTSAAATTTEAEGPVVLQAGRFDPLERRLVGAEGAEVPLSPTETRLLSYLASRPGRTIAYRTLLDEVWGYARGVSSRTVYATMHRLRSKVELDPAEPRHIITIAGVGYRFDPL